MNGNCEFRTDKNHENLKIIEGLASEFTALYRADLDTGCYRNYVSTDRIVEVRNMFSQLPKTIDLYNYFIENFVHPDHRRLMHDFYHSDEQLRGALEGIKSLRINFLRCYKGVYLWTGMEIVKCEAIDKPAHKVIFGFIECDASYRGDLALKNCFSVLSKAQSPAEAIAELLAIAGEFHGADRVCFCEIDYKKSCIGNVQEWLHEGVPSLKKQLSQLVLSDLDSWFDEFSKNGILYITDCKNKFISEFDLLFMKRAGIESFIATPIIQNDKFIGFITVDNPIKAQKNHQLLNIIVNIVYSEILKRDEQRRHQLEELESLDRETAAKNQILSDITKALYSFNLTVDIERGSFKLITGTGGNEAIAVIQSEENYREVYERMIARMRPEYHDRFRELISLDYLRLNCRQLGYFATDVYQTVGDEENARWGEVNVTFGIDGKGRPVANLLGRDITKIKREEAQQEREIRAAQAKNEVLSGITQTLYGFNITINLVNNTYTLITGTGADEICEFFKSGLERPYTELADRFLFGVLEEHRKNALQSIGRDILLGYRRQHGHLGTQVIPWKNSEDKIYWLEINAFMGENGKGEPVVNLLGRNVTEQHERHERQERERAAAAAKDRILSGITQALYGYNVTVNLNTLACSIIRGTGMDCIVDVIEKIDNYQKLIDECLWRMPKEHHADAMKLLSVKAIRDMANNGVSGFAGSVTYAYKCSLHGWHWHEINIFIGTNANGEPTANLLARDVTEQYEEQARKEHEREAAAAKDRILSEITQALYGYNLTVNLRTLKYTIIIGTGMEAACKVFESTNDYEKAAALKSEFVVPEDREELMKMLCPAALKQMAEDGISGAVGATVYEANVNGEHQWHETNIFIGTDSNGDPIANILGRNVTEQYEEQERREREARAAAAKDQILSGITQALYGYNVTVDLDTLECSVIRGTGMDCIVDAIEYSSDYNEILHEFEKRVPREQLVELRELIAIKAMRGKAIAGITGFVGNVEHESICGVHGRHWHEVNLFIGSNEHGHPIANILARDVTEQHERLQWQQREREAVAAKDRILSEITQSIYGYNLTVNLKTLKYTLITGTGMDAACAILKQSDDYEAAIKLKLDFIVPNDREHIAKLLDAESLKKAAEKKSCGVLETAVYEANVNGEHQWHEINIFIGTDANGDPIANILGRDITEQHTRADAAAQLLAAQEASRAKTKFLFSMSHDIRTPMNAIRGFTDIAKKSIGDTERLADCLNKIDSSSELLLSLINSVLDMSRVESGKAKIEETVGDVKLSFASIETTMGELAKAKGIELSFGFGRIVHQFVYADYDRCNRVFVNIISNAIKYSKPNGWVKVKCEELPDEKVGEGNSDLTMFRYTFTDNGIGMSEEFLNHVFEEFSREKNSTTSGIQGTGLGLSLCKSFVELMGGTIKCQSKQNEGTVFTVDLPFRIQKGCKYIDTQTGEEKDAETPEVATEVVQELFTGKRVLLVEDNKLNREVAEFFLEDQGFEVESVEDGSIAVRQVREKGLDYYDCILMDIQMPIMGGFEATKIIRGEGYRHPIIALSANAFAEDKVASIAAGMDDHVAKPLKISELTAALLKAKAKYAN